jgi:hypothetical protein
VGEFGLALELGAAVLLVPAALLWLGRRARSRGLGSTAMGPWEEIWDPVAHRTSVEVRVQAERSAPPPAAGDPPVPR